jgi:hypothetical protein
VSEPRKRNLFPLLPTECDLRYFEWPLEKKAYGLLWVLLPLCPFWWLIDKREPNCSSPSREQEREWNHRRANWVIGWLVLLIALWLIGPDSQPWQAIVGALAALRLLEIFVTGLGTILDQRQQIRARNVVTILIYAVQVTLIFAILYHSFAAGGFVGLKPGDSGPVSASDYLYISWSAVVSLGNSKFTPNTAPARFLEVATTTTAIFLLTVLFAYAIDTVKKGEKDEEGPSNGPDDCCYPPSSLSSTPTPCLTGPCPPPDPCYGTGADPYPRLSLLLDYMRKSSRLRARLRKQRHK